MALTKESAARKDAATHGDFQHRHFATVARILKGKSDLANYGAFCRHFASELVHTNPRFDRRRFLAACGLED